MLRIGSAVFLVFLSAVCSGLLTAQSSPRQITGQVRLGSQPAPEGVSVSVQIVGGKYATPSSEPEVAHGVTDAKGRFTLDHLEKLGSSEGREFFAITAKAPGYSPAFQVVDLTLVAKGEITLELQKEGLHKTDSAADAPEPGPRRSTNAEAQRHLDLAQELLFRKGVPEASIEELKQAIKADPWYAPAYILLGLANMQLQRWGDAQLAFSEAAKVEPGNAQAYLGQGSALNEEHDYAAAQKALKHSLELAPDSAEAHYELARTFSALGQWEAAAPHAQRALEINPDYSGPHALMANIYLEQQDLSSARREFQEYLRLDPGGSLAPAAKQTIAEIDRALAQGKDQKKDR
jgi:tetratricopeptide (TPR) repeat protein